MSPIQIALVLVGVLPFIITYYIALSAESKLQSKEHIEYAYSLSLTRINMLVWTAMTIACAFIIGMLTKSVWLAIAVGYIGPIAVVYLYWIQPRTKGFNNELPDYVRRAIREITEPRDPPSKDNDS
jgi:Flp pilus assembly protein TadB